MFSWTYIKKISIHYGWKIGRTMRKRVFGHMRTAKAQISLRMRADEDPLWPLMESLGTVEHTKYSEVPDQLADLDLY